MHRFQEHQLSISRDNRKDIYENDTEYTDHT